MVRTMKWLLLCGLAGGLLVASNVTLFGAELDPDAVRNAMAQGVKYLKSEQKPSGTWSEYGGQEGGITALCTLALLNAGESPEDPNVKLALNYLRNLRPKTTYVISLQTMVLCRAQPKRDQDLIAHNVEWLVNTQLPSGPPDRKGGWSYGSLPKEGSVAGDASNSQFAMLALYEASRIAETHEIILPEIPLETWRQVQNYWVNNQRDDNGSWGYYKPMEGTGSMTCAGISSLVIADDVLHEPDARVIGDRIDPDYRGPSVDQEKIERGVNWLRDHFSVQANPPSTTSGNPLWHYYYLYGLERAGRLSSRRKIGEHDWYREGAKYLVGALGTDLMREAWKGGGHAEDNQDIATSLALLFLSKGRWPVLMAKVQYGARSRSLSHLADKDIEWNRHRNDVHNLTFYVENHWKLNGRPQEMTWQVIDLRQASVDDLLQVPVLFFSGGGNPLPSDPEEQKKLAANLRDYFDRGGFVFADGERSGDFDKGFRKLMELVFEKPEYSFKPLDRSHPIWSMDEKVPAAYPHLLLGIDYGCRTSVVYAPANPADDPMPSLATLWELSRGGHRAAYSGAVLDQIQAGMAIGINVLAYATNRQLVPKDLIREKLVIPEKPDRIVRGKFCVAKLEHPGGCDAAPRALANLMEQAAHDMNLRVETHPKLIGMQDKSLYDYPMVFMHGRNAFRLLEGERQALRDYVERGGLLFADAICGNEAFADSFRREMGLIFPKNRLESIPADDPMWTHKYGGFDLKSVKRRDPQAPHPGEPIKSVVRSVPVELKGIRFGDRYGVIFSEFDLSCALEKHDSMECRGYTREDAARIGLNVLRYAIQQ
jgi:hypothetical protein